MEVVATYTCLECNALYLSPERYGAHDCPDHSGGDRPAVMALAREIEPRAFADEDSFRMMDDLCILDVRHGGEFRDLTQRIINSAVEKAKRHLANPQ